MAYAAALARQNLGRTPENVRASISANIIKNVKSVVVPNTGGLHGISAAISAGIIAGDASKKLEVLSCVNQEQIAEIVRYMNQVPMEITQSDSGLVFDIGITVQSGTDSAFVRISGFHTNVVRIEKNGAILLSSEYSENDKKDEGPDYSLLNVQDIVDFADHVDLSLVEDILKRQIEYNTAISEEGLRGGWGAEIGRVLRDSYGDDVSNLAKASAVEAGLLGMQMQMHGKEFFGGDGIVTKGVENTIDNVDVIARVGMAETNRQIIRIMINNPSGSRGSGDLKVQHP